MDVLIDRVVVTDGQVKIRYAILTSQKSEQVRFCHLRSDYLDGVTGRQKVGNNGKQGEVYMAAN